MKITNLKLGQILLNSGVLSQEQLHQALVEQKTSRKRLGQLLIDNHFITESQLINSLVEQLSIPYVDLGTIRLDSSLSTLVPEAMAMSHMIVPIKKDGSVLTVAVADPLDYNGLNDIGTYTKLKINPVIAERGRIEMKIKELYTAQKAYAAAQELAITQTQQNATINADETYGDETAQPIVRFVNNMIEQAVLQKASDIHIEPQDGFLRIRFRVDGHLSVYMDTSMELHAAVVSRIKFIGGMNIAEKRIPQDGRINYRLGSTDIDMRLSVLPSVNGEKVVMRITTALGLEMKKDQIGFLPENLKRFEKLIHNNHGIVLLTGPTGSGKSTTLYTALKEIMREDINIVTVENPVELIIPGITQVDINPRAGLTFASVLRSVLRQDPDVVMIGEIRDEETADIASSMAITGHLVFSTLHTYDAASSVVRLIDMGVEPFMVAASVLGIVSQRLVRKLCPHCREAYFADGDELSLLGIKTEEKISLYRKKGCQYCSHKGYVGRTAVHEVMEISPRIKAMINQGVDMDTIKQASIDEGMIPMEENMKRIVLNGTTSMEELQSLIAEKF